MTYTVTITPASGQKDTHPCAGSDDQEALIYAGKIVEQQADKGDPNAAVVVERNGQKVGPEMTVADMINRSV